MCLLQHVDCSRREVRVCYGTQRQPTLIENKNECAWLTLHDNLPAEFMQDLMYQ